MSTGWSDADKTVARRAAEQAQAAAEQEALQLFRAYPVKTAEDLWKLELQIREWRRDRWRRFNLNYETAEDRIAEWLNRGWLTPEAISAFSNARRERLIAFKPHRR